mmetsp:Transcript_92700/g.233054  ORF Transcript_92700/g.233054 Transcript_92700/m.233054 type:complete len:92 (-) Transcript_92700:205-480(-)
MPAKRQAFWIHLPDEESTPGLLGLRPSSSTAQLAFQVSANACNDMTSQRQAEGRLSHKGSNGAAGANRVEVAGEFPQQAAAKAAAASARRT